MDRNIHCKSHAMALMHTVFSLIYVVCSLRLFVVALFSPPGDIAPLRQFMLLSVASLLPVKLAKFFASDTVKKSGKK
ncbi:hypothetical protein KX16_003569 [Salmonella enterica subsp. enterica]|nr:hypothetical protein [Salmonella enterica subsp. enterica serovar Mikawasima]